MDKLRKQKKRRRRMNEFSSFNVVIVNPTTRNVESWSQMHKWLCGMDALQS